MSQRYVVVFLLLFLEWLLLSFTSLCKCMRWFYRLTERDIHCRSFLSEFCLAVLVLLTPCKHPQFLDYLLSSNKPYHCHHLLSFYLSWLKQLLPVLENLQCLHNSMNLRYCTVWHFSATESHTQPSQFILLVSFHPVKSKIYQTQHIHLQLEI